MNLAELKRQVDNAIEVAADMNEDPERITVTLQIERVGQTEALCAHAGAELVYDGGIQATGCVIVAWAD
jgi:hypothetical protein